MLGLGLFEIVILFFPFLLGQGAPLGMPAGLDDPVLWNLATDDCLAYSYWTGTKPLEAQQDPTQAFMARPELGLFLQKFRRVSRSEMVDGLRAAGVPEEESFAQILDAVAWGIFQNPSCLVIHDLQMPANEVIAFDEKFFQKVEGGLFQKLGPERPEVEQLFQRVRTSWQPRYPEWVSEINGNVCLRYPADDETIAVWFTVRDGYLILGSNPQWMSTVQWLQTDKPRAPWLVDLDQNLAVPNRGSLSYVNLEKCLLIAERALAQDWLLGTFPWEKWRNIKSVGFATGLDSQGALQRMRLVGDLRQLTEIELLADGGISPELLEGIPLDNSLMGAARINPEGILKLVVEGVGSRLGVAEAEDLDTYLNSFDEFLGVNIREDLLKSMEGFVFLYGQVSIAEPTRGWLLGARLQDEMSFDVSLNRVSERVREYAEANDMGFTVQEIQGVSIKTVVGPNEFGPPFQISYAVVDKHFLVAIDPNTLGDFVARLKDRESWWISKSKNTQYFSGPESQKFGTPIAVGELHFAGLLRILAQFARPMMDAEWDLIPDSELKMKDIPSTESLTDEVGPSTLALYRTPAGIEGVIRQTYPVSSPLASLAFWGTQGLNFRTMSLEYELGSKTMDKLMRISWALESISDDTSAFPAQASTDETGRPLLSWRVHLLPYLGETELYEKFRLNEPWDSEHNKSLIELMPAIYKSVGVSLEPGKTLFCGVSDERGVLAPTQKPRSKQGVPRDLVTNLSAVAVVEVVPDRAVIWTAPQDFVAPAEPETVREALRLSGPQGYCVVLANGTSLFVHPKVTEASWRALLIRTGENSQNIWELNQEARDEEMQGDGHQHGGE